MAITQLGNGLSAGKHHEDSLSVRKAELAMKRRIGASEERILETQTNLAITYQHLGRLEQAMLMQKDVYSGRLKLHGEENGFTLTAANNYASSLVALKRLEETKPLLRKMIPVARRTLGESKRLTLLLRWNYAKTLCLDTGATFDDIREAVTTLEETERTARRVLGGAHPLTVDIEGNLRNARIMLRAREGDVEPLRAAVEAMAPGDA